MDSMVKLNTSLVTVILLMFGARHCQSNSGKMNVLFLASDDMRPEIGAYLGTDFPSPIHPDIKTPNLDQLAGKSLLLKRAYVQQAVCSPSRTSLLTGRRPDTTHVYDLNTYFREFGFEYIGQGIKYLQAGGNYTTLPQYFKDHGYATVGMGKIFHPGVASGDNDPVSWSEPYIQTGSKYDSNPWGTLWHAVADDLLVNHPLIDMDIADKAIDTLKRLGPKAKAGGEPFFVAAGFHKPHLPFIMPQSFLDLYPTDTIRLPANPYAPVDMPEVAWSSFDEIRSYPTVGNKYGYGYLNTTLPDSLVLALRRAYYAAVSYTDAQVGRVIRALDDLGLANSTIISFWGDHGWQLGEHGEWCKHTNFELATHAPMMVHVPGLTDKGIVTEKLTEFVDLYPTLAEAAGLPKVPVCPAQTPTMSGACTEGSSLLPLVSDPGRDDWKQAVFSQYPRLDVAGDTYMGYTMRTDRFRYTEWVEFRRYPHFVPQWDKIYKKTSIELYDHAADPEENVNVAFRKDYQSYVKQLSVMLHDGWRKQLPQF